ncbi:hypothetical protein [Yersinia hibernica]|uniref:hypothetical protein n=1 Tax=Yersinia hibernica TaxID=2339259 RepID=UPI0011A93320|nr:hypothetical protein [Yersinia hibernica]
MQADFTLNTAQWAALKKELAALELPPNKRKRLLWRLLKNGVMVVARQHVRKQENADGVKWPARWNGRKDKMMRKLPGMMVIREMPATESAKIYLRGSKPIPAGVIGAIQQSGAKTTVTAAAVKRNQSGKRMASLRQAKKLIDLGYIADWVTAPRKPSVAEIMGTLTRQKASVIIRKMEGKDPKSAWPIDLPAREWLAVNDDEFNKMLARQLQAINYGSGIRAQDIKGKVKK